MRAKLVDRSSPVPAYHQIAIDLADRIAAGEWPIHGKMPTEGMLAEQYEVSRITLRKALANLESQKLIEVHQGKGIFVAAIPKPFVEDLGFPGAEKQSKSFNKSKLLNLEEAATAPQTVLDALGLAPGQGLVYLERLFSREDIIIGLNRAWFPLDAVPGLARQGLVNDSISTTLQQRYGYDVQQVESFVEATRMNAREAGLLEVPYDSTALKIQSVYTTQEGKILEYASTLWLGDLTRFKIVVNRSSV